MSSYSNSPAGSVVPETSRVRTSRRSLVCGCNGARHHHQHVCLLDLMWRCKICVCWTLKWRTVNQKKEPVLFKLLSYGFATENKHKKRLSLRQQWTELQQNHPQKKKKKRKESYCSSTDKQLTAQFSPPQLFFSFKDPSRVCNSLSIVMQLWWRVTLLRACRRATYTTADWQ